MMLTIKPQPGPQTYFLSSSADIAIYGGAAGGGKTFSLLMEPLRHLNNALFRGVIFRRTSPQIRNVGGLWDESTKLYSLLGLGGRETNLDWTCWNGWQLKFSHLEQESDKFNWQGAQMCFLGFDELTHFSESQFFYLFSRLRSLSGIKGYVRATCNPDSESWLSSFLAWWIDQESGFPIKEHSGRVRWFWRVNDSIEWANSKEDLIAQFPEAEPKSVTFISASIFDNKLLLQKDPSYLSNLKVLPLIEREQLLGGNWKIRPSRGMFFRQEWFEVSDCHDYSGVAIRFWDRAATLPTSGSDPDWTVGCKIRKNGNGLIWIDDIVRFRGTPATVMQKIKDTALADGESTWIGLSQDPGQAGIVEISFLTQQLMGFKVKVLKETGSKATRAQPVSAQAEVGNIKVRHSHWNKCLFDELENFPNGKHDDQVDALAGAFSLIKDVSLYQGPRIRSL